MERTAQAAVCRNSSMNFAMKIVQLMSEAKQGLTITADDDVR
jgi:hypothetical protein